MQGFDSFSIIKSGELSNVLWSYFNSLMKVGFTRDESIKIILEMVRATAPR